ncbi:MobF family relaxase [Microbispora sp. CA-102843]|uniref:MobF family relaxase n=1 Tax=Microbispora sp. CA-102843 TaxID=3239952 RepID=UPI003D9012AA
MILLRKIGNSRPRKARREDPAAVLSVATGYDPGYLTRQVAPGAEGYYLSAVGAGGGEPPGRWTGRGCAELGLSGLVDADVMTALYRDLRDPRDPAGQAILGKAPRRYKSAEQIAAEMLAAEPDATPERVEQIHAEAARKARNAVMFFDATFSPSKSVSLLHAGFQAAAVEARERGDLDAAAEMEARAEAVWDAVRFGSSVALEYLQDAAGYTRTGYHGAIPTDEAGRPLTDRATGRFEDAHEWIVASFDQHTSRANDPQLHIHNAILNRVKSPDGQYRTIDSRALNKARRAAGELGERAMEAQLTRTLGVQWQTRADGKGREIVGISDEQREAFSSRRVRIRREVAELVEAYKAKHGTEPSRRAVFRMAQFVTLDSREAKSHGPAPSREALLARWEAQATASEVGALSGIPERVCGRVDAARAAEADALADARARDIQRAALAELESERAAWNEFDLVAAIARHIPDEFSTLPAESTRALVQQLAAEALAPGAGLGIHRLDPAPLVPTPGEWMREGGRSVYDAAGRALYATARQLQTEERLTRAAGEAGAPATEAERAAEVLGGSPVVLAALLDGERNNLSAGPEHLARAAEHLVRAGAAAGNNPSAGSEHLDRPAALAGNNTSGWRDGLRDDQAAAVYGVLTSGRRIDVLVGPAGAGKSRAMGTLSDLWGELIGGRVVGLAVSQAAAEVLAGEGCTDTANVARFLTEARAGRALLRAGDLVVIDEASMIASRQLAEIEALASAAGAKLLLTGDPQQLGAVGDGGAMTLIARDHGYYQLTEVQRMNEAWEREASLGLRRGDAAALHAYDARGRLLEGDGEQMTETAYRRWLADYLAGKDTVLLAASNVEARELAERARAELVELGLVEAEGVRVREGLTAGVGDRIMTRQNTRRITDDEGRPVTNRDVLKIDGWVRSADPDHAEPVAAQVRRYLGRDETGAEQWTAPYTVGTRYLATQAELAYASTVHAAQGRTVDTTHSVIRPGVGRNMLYVMMSRGREANYAYTVTDQPSADMDPRHAAAPELAEAQRRAEREAAGVPSAAEAVHAAAGTGRGRFAVLLDALETDEGERAATQVMRDEHLLATHTAHLEVLWTDATRDAARRLVDATLAEVLTPDQLARFTAESDEGPRGTLYRLARAAELAGHDAAELVRSAVAARPLDGEGADRAESIAKVLHYRIKRQLGTDAPAPVPAVSYADRTPQADPAHPAAELLDHARQVAALMDDRRRELGTQVAEQPPAWAVAALGPVPADPIERAEWEHRAGVVASYREAQGFRDEARPIGHCPNTPEARATWNAAYDALGRPEDMRDVYAMNTGELGRIVHNFSRKEAHAPVPVADELRAVSQAEVEARTRMELARRQAAAETDAQRRAELLDQAAQYAGLVEALTSERVTFELLHGERERYVESTAAERERVAIARAIVLEREPDAMLPDCVTPDLAPAVALDAPLRAEQDRQEAEAEREAADVETPERGEADQPQAVAEPPAREADVPEGQFALDLGDVDQARERDEAAELRRRREAAEREEMEAVAAELEAEQQARAEAREREADLAQAELDLGLTVIGEDGHRARGGLLPLTARAIVSAAQAMRKAEQERAREAEDRDEYELDVEMRAAAVRQGPQRRREDEQARSIDLDDDGPERTLV